MFDLKTRILIVDDMSTMRKLVKKACMAIGFTEFVEAGDGAQGFEALGNSALPIGLILSDWNMPNCTGIDLLKRVRADTRFKHLPFLLITAETEQHQVVEAAAARVSGYLIKPFSAEQIRQRLEEASARMKAG
jgi:two-component system chemotaxis response regulator CheY